MIIFEGNDRYAYRDPACTLVDGVYYLFFTVSEKQNSYMYNYLAMSKSTDLKEWSKPRILTEKNLLANYTSPGNIIKKNGEYIICLCSYPLPEPYADRWYANDDARLYTIRTKDFITFSQAELLNPKGDIPPNKIGRMIDPFIVCHNGYKLFFKQNGRIAMSESRDLKNWKYIGEAEGGENACVIKQGDEFILVHSPENGIGFKRSADMKKWEDMHIVTLGQDKWEWAKGRITAGFIMEAPEDFRYKYILFFHGSRDIFPETHGNATLAMAFTNDFKNFCF